MNYCKFEERQRRIQCYIRLIGSICGQLERVDYEESIIMLDPHLSVSYHSRDIARPEIVNDPIILSYLGQPVGMHPVEKKEIERYVEEYKRDFSTALTQREKALSEILDHNKN